MKFTTFASLYDTRPHTYEGWDAFVKQLNQPTITQSKKSVMLYSPAVYVDGAATRSNANVSYLSFLVADLDDANEDQVMDLLQYFQDCGIACFFHTTHSFAEGLQEGKFKGRLIVPADRIMEPDEWDRIWLGFREFCLLAGAEIDPACKDPSRSYFFPSAPKEEDCFVEQFVGGPINVELLLEIAPAVQSRSSFRAPSKEALAKIESTTRFQLAKSFLTAYEAAIQGQHGDLRTYRAACVGNDFALTKEEFWPLFLEYNTRCVPPWDEDELEKKLDNAYQYATMPTGWRLAGENEDDAVTEDDVGKLITKLLKRQYTAPTGRMLRSMLNGTPLTGADPVTSLRKIAEALGEEYSRANPKNLAELFQESIDESEKENRDINLDAFATFIKTRQEDIQAAAAANRMRIQESVAARYAEAFRSIGVSRQTPYTDEELDSFKKQFPNGGEAAHLWIVQHDSTYYFRVDDRYVGPFRRDAWNSGKILLSPSKVEFSEYSPQRGVRPRSLSSLVDEYGCVAHGVVLDMTAQKSMYDPQTLTFTEAPCPMRDIEPRYHHNVDRWISALCGGNNEMHAKFLDWLASVPEVDKPTCALVIYGAAQTGKSLLGSALARIWTTAGPTEIEDVVGSFNSMQARCPLVLADETTPQEGGKPNTRLLRKLITQHERTLKRKNIPDSKLIGAMRLVMTANSLDGLIYQHDELNDHDIEALCERFLLVKVHNDNAKRFLDSLSHQDRMAITHYTAIAEHTLWLWKNRKVQWGKRLLVEGFQESELATALRAGTGLRPEVIEFVAEWLVHPERIAKAHYQPVVETLPDGRTVAMMSAKTLKEHWKSIHGDDVRVPRLRNLSRALQALSVTMRRSGSKTYYELDLHMICLYAGDMGMDVYGMNEGMKKLGLPEILFPDIVSV